MTIRARPQKTRTEGNEGSEERGPAPHRESKGWREKARPVFPAFFVAFVTFCSNGYFDWKNAIAWRMAEETEVT